MGRITVDIDNVKPFITDVALEYIQKEICDVHGGITRGEGAGCGYLGWQHIPSTISTDLVRRIKDTAQYVRENADVFITIGIGGSYLGARAAIEFVNHSFFNNLPKRDAGGGPEMYYAGQNISSDYLSDLIEIVQDRRICLNVISKSGTTLEPAVAFRILKKLVEDVHGKEDAGKRIIVTTDRENGALKRVADDEGYTTFEIPDDVGGRFSVLTPVGLVPVAVAGIDIEELLDGARVYEEITSTSDIYANPAYMYSAVRNILYRNGKVIELVSSFHPSLHYLAEWWKQLAGESEGKGNAGIFPASVEFTTDLHSMGQWIQEGARNIFETFLLVERSNKDVNVPFCDNDEDGLNYIAARPLDYVNGMAYEGTAAAHRDGGVPNLSVKLPDRSPNVLGQIIYFFEKAIAVSGYLQGVNPFDQPGVEFYKKNMFALLKGVSARPYED